LSLQLHFERRRIKQKMKKREKNVPSNSLTGGGPSEKIPHPEKKRSNSGGSFNVVFYRVRTEKTIIARVFFKSF